MAVPGILYVSTKLPGSELSPELFNQWYDEIHISDVLKTSVMLSRSVSSSVSAHFIRARILHFAMKL